MKSRWIRGQSAGVRRRPSAGRIAVIAVALIAVVAATSSAKSGGAAAAAKDGGTITVGFYHDGYWDSIDPNLWYGLSTWEVGRQTCVPLVWYPNAGGKAGSQLVPGVAAAMPTVSDKGLTYTFTLRSGLKFSNGAPLTAEDYKYTFYRMDVVNPDAADIFAAIKGTDAVVAGKAKEVSGITASGDQLVFHLSQANGGFLQSLSLQFTCPVPNGTPTKRDESGKIPSNGPYMITSYDPGRELDFERNPNFDPATGAKGHADKLVFDLALDESQALQKLKVGEIDLTFDPLPPADGQLALTDPSLKGRVFKNSSPSLTYMWMNTDVAPFNNAKVRQAVNYAVDRTQIGKVVGGKTAAVTTDQILPPSLAGDSPRIYPLLSNLAKARALMKQSGIKLPLTTTLDTPSTAGFPAIAQVIQADLKQIGINLKLNVATQTVLSAASGKRANHRPAGFSVWTQDYPDAGDWLPLLDPRFVEQGGQKARFHVGSLTPTFVKIEKESGAKRQSDYQKLATKLMRDYAPWVPLFDQVITQATSSKVTGYTWQPQVGLAVLTSMSVK
jgi:peptide/nickel transport system substrate-binding protein